MTEYKRRAADNDIFTKLIESKSPLAFVRICVIVCTICATCLTVTGGFMMKQISETQQVQNQMVKEVAGIKQQVLDDHEILFKVAGRYYGASK